MFIVFIINLSFKLIYALNLLRKKMQIINMLKIYIRANGIILNLSVAAKWIFCLILP